jgi:hypothetical protein
MDKKHLVVWRHGGIKSEAHVLAEELHGDTRGRWRRQTCPLSRCWVNHQRFVIFDLVVVVPKTKKAVAVVLDLQTALIVRVHVAEVCSGDSAPRERVCEELERGRVEPREDEDPVERMGEEIRPQQAAVVDHGTPAITDAAGRGEAAGRETAEEAGEDVVGQQLRRRQGHCVAMSLVE